MKNGMKQIIRLTLCGMMLLAGSASGDAAEDLNGAQGKIFNVNLSNKSFELLKRTVYDPETGEGKSRHTVYWNDKTTFSGQNEIGPEDISKGFWKAKIHGRESNGKFIIESVELERLVDPRSTDDPDLPRVLVVGDSISMNYEKAAKAALKGVANYHRNEGNCFSTYHGVAFMEYWLGDYTREGLLWDVIQFNHGLHDLKQRSAGAEYAVPIEDYKKNLKKEIEIMKKTGATLIWCSTTPVPNSRGGKYGRQKGAEKVFNEAAMEVMRQYPEVQVNDLCKVVNESSVFDNWRKKRDVHFYRPEEQAVLGKAVADAVIKALAARKAAADKKANKLNKKKQKNTRSEKGCRPKTLP